MNIKNVSLFNNFGAVNLNVITSHADQKYFFDTDVVNNTIKLFSENTDFYTIFLGSGFVYQDIIAPNKLDFSSNLFCSSWYGVDLGLEPSRNIIFILSQLYLSKIDDPRTILRVIKKYLLSNAQTKLLIFFDDFLGFNVKFTFDEFLNFLESSGFNLEVNSHYIVVTINSSAYERYLEKFLLDKHLVYSTYMLLTTEDIEVKMTGGIGTYTRNLKSLVHELVVLNCDLDNDLDMVCKANSISPYHFNDDYNFDNFVNGLGILEVVRCVLYLYPFLHTIELQDFLGYGFRIVQAKKTGQLPAELSLKVFLHGSIDHMKYASKNFDSLAYNMTDLIHIVKDSYILENSENVIAPSKYIANHVHTNEYGYKLSNLIISKLPYLTQKFDHPRLIPANDIEFKKLVFIGKYVDLKGWGHFISLVKILHESGILNEFSEVVSICPGVPSINDETVLKELCVYKYYSFRHDDMIKYLQDRRHDSVFVIPAQGESYSLVVLELMLAGCAFIAYNKGAVPELLEGYDLLDQVLCDTEPKFLAEHVKYNLELSKDILALQIYKRQLFAFARQNEINLNCVERLKCKSALYKILDINFNQDITVGIPIYNTKVEFIADLLKSINNSTVLPEIVLFIDDGSSINYLTELKDVIVTTLNSNIPYIIISQENKGLAAARNTALNNCRTKYLMVLDSDDIILPNTLRDLAISLTCNEDIVASAGFHADFRDLEEINRVDLYSNANMVWKPLGTELARALSLYSNHYMSANCMVKTDIIKILGGWDDADKATWEDWAFYSKLAWSGYKFTVMPIVACLYRRNPHSMSQTYNTFFGWRRIVRNIPVLSKLDATIITRIIYTNTQNTNDSFNVTNNEMKFLLKFRNMRKNSLIRLAIKIIYKLKGL